MYKIMGKKKEQSLFDIASMLLSGYTPQALAVFSAYPAFSREVVSCKDAESLLRFFKALDTSSHVKISSIESGLKSLYSLKNMGTMGTMGTLGTQQVNDKCPQSPRKESCDDAEKDYTNFTKLITHLQSEADKELEKERYMRIMSSKSLQEKLFEYRGTTTKQLYLVCCHRGLSGRCKDRKRETLMTVLIDADIRNEDKEKEQGLKRAKELYRQCKEKGLCVEQKRDAEFYERILSECENDTVNDEKKED